MATQLAVRRLSNKANFYDPKVVEKKWQQLLGSVKPSSSSDNYSYILPMFPYPSGELHMGHVRVYTLSDTLAQYHRMKGNNVLHPIGWDSFGLPAENAAIERGHAPSVWTNNNIEIMKEQLTSLGVQFNWNKELSTCSPSYYKWTQWLFLQLYENGLAYRKEGVVNWDPVDCTVLANEQVDGNGLSWRSGAKVEEKVLNQWYLRITNYAEKLLTGLDDLKWPERVTNDQRNWIGRSEGIVINFPIKDSNDSIQVFTTCPEHIYGASFIALSSEHHLVSQQVTEVIHPLTGRILPVHVTEYVLNDYGTGAVMGVPGHNELDYDFAIDNNLPIIKVITEKGHLINSQQFDGMTEPVARDSISEHLKMKGLGDYKVCYKLRDWCISRQRYWGTPIPVLYCPNCGIIPDNNLPVHLPDSIQLTGRGLSPLLQADQWINTKCHKCGGDSKRETDTMDTFVDSSWYYVRYLDPHNQNEIVSKSQSFKQLPVDVYIGGIEHAILHLLYARFINHFLHDIGLVPNKEPFHKLLTQGMVLGESYVNPVTGEYVKSNELKGDEVKVWEKMSKSKHNGINPTDVIDQYGADTVRLYVLFKGPPEIDINWDTKAIMGVFNWLKRIWKLIHNHKLCVKENNSDDNNDDDSSNELLVNATNRAINEVTASFEKRFTFNVAIAELMKLSNVLKKETLSLMGSVSYHNSILILLKLLSPMAPHITSQLWEDLRETSQLLNYDQEIGTLMEQKWPDPLINDVPMNIVIQINGRNVKVLSSKSVLTDEKQVTELLENEQIVIQKDIDRMYISERGNFVNIVTV